jgi:hypothetical protein
MKARPCFIVDNEDEAVAPIERIGELNRWLVRARFEERFTAEWPRTIFVTTRSCCKAKRAVPWTPSDARWRGSCAGTPVRRHAMRLGLAVYATRAATAPSFM